MDTDMGKRPIYIDQIMKQVREKEKNDGINYFSPKNNIDDGFIIVNYEKLELNPTDLMDGQIHMVFPDTFQKISKDDVEKLYLNKAAPQFMYKKEGTLSAFTFSILNSENLDDDFSQIEKMCSMNIKECFPDMEVMKENFYNSDAEEGILFIFDRSKVNEERFIMLFFIKLRDGILTGSFECNPDDKKQWKPIIKQLITTLEESD